MIGLADPFWFLIASLEIGFAVGLCVLGDANPPAALGAILLLFPSNYLLAASSKSESTGWSAAMPVLFSSSC